MIVDEIYEEFEDWLRRFAMGLTHDGDRADDLVQDTMIRALANLHLLDLIGYYQRRSWLRLHVARPVSRLGPGSDLGGLPLAGAVLPHRADRSLRPPGAGCGSRSVSVSARLPVTSAPLTISYDPTI